MGIPVQTAGGPWWVEYATLRKKQLNYGDIGQFCRNWMLGNVQDGKKLPSAAYHKEDGHGHNRLLIRAEMVLLQLY
jgi:hypothetical protein